MGQSVRIPVPHFFHDPELKELKANSNTGLKERSNIGLIAKFLVSAVAAGTWNLIKLSGPIRISPKRIWAQKGYL